MRQKVSCETWSLDPKNNVFIRAQTVIKLTRTIIFDHYLDKTPLTRASFSGGARHQGGGGGGGLRGKPMFYMGQIRGKKLGGLMRPRMLPSPPPPPP